MTRGGTTSATLPTDPDLAYFAGNDQHDTAVSVQGEQFLINGLPTYPGRTWNDLQIEGLLLNSRMVNGIYDDMDGVPPAGMLPWDARLNAEDYIANMSAWRAQGLTAFTINLQGGSNRCNGLAGDGQIARVDNNPYGSNGSKAFDDWSADVDSPHARYLARLGSVIRAADDLGMVVILGLFYFGQDEGLADETAVIAAVDAATDWILDNGWTNVIIEVNNEANGPYDRSVLKEDRVHELIQRVQTRSSGPAGAHLPEGRLLVSTSSTSGFMPPDAWIDSADFVLLHGNGMAPGGIRSLVDSVRANPLWQANPKPILFNEDSTKTTNFQAAVEKYAGWGYFDSDGYQCVYSSDVTDRWTLQKATNGAFWPLLANMTGAEAPLLPGTILMEAENMTLAGYRADPANPDWIMLQSNSGQAIAPFPGPNGTYSIIINAVAENDGQSTLELWIDGVLQDTFIYPLASSSNREPVALTGPTLSLATGMEIKLVGYKDTTSLGVSHARVDDVTFMLEGGAGQPTPTPTPTPAPPIPTPTPTPTPTCEVFVRIDGVEQWITKPATFCQ